jgi:RNA polymerase sigma-70 factor (ECF subfamily)
MEENSLDISFSKGDEDALCDAINIYGQKLLRYCHNILCNYSEAQDAVQITFIKAHKKREEK